MSPNAHAIDARMMTIDDIEHMTVVFHRPPKT
jgi:hypothetical protein